MSTGFTVGLGVRRVPPHVERQGSHTSILAPYISKPSWPQAVTHGHVAPLPRAQAHWGCWTVWAAGHARLTSVQAAACSPGSSDAVAAQPAVTHSPRWPDAQAGTREETQL